MSNMEETVLGESLNATAIPTSVPPIFSKCLSCADYGATCRGFDLVSLGEIAAVRSFHKAMKKARTIPLKVIAAAAPIISEATVNEYFSNVAKDYKWTTVVAIDNALLSICGHRVGLPPIDHSCPSASSGFRNELAVAELKLSQAEQTCDALRKQIADSEEMYAAQLSNIRDAEKSEIGWLKKDIALWRRMTFILMGVGLILLACLLVYVGIDISHPATGLIKY